MRISYITISCISLLLASCSGSRDAIRYSGSISVPVEYEATDSVLNDSYMFNFPSDIFVTDSLIIVHDSNGMEMAFHVFNKEDGTHIMDFGHRGRGPGETLNISSVNFSGGYLYAYDANLQKLVSYDVSKTISGKPEWTETDLSGIAPNMLLQVLPVGHGKLLLCGNSDRMRFGIFDRQSGKIESATNEYPSYSKDDEANWAVSNYSASVRFNITRNKMVTTTYIGATMEIYDLSSGVLDKTVSEYYYKPVFSYAVGAVPRWVTPGDDSVIGFQDLYLDDSGIFGLVWGMESSEMEWSVPALYKFGYDGCPVCKYSLSDILESVAIDRNGDIYGMALNDSKEFIIKKYIVSHQ